MGKSLLKIGLKSLARHAIVGVLTGGTGNAALLALDAMDLHDAMDAADAMDAVSSSGDCYSSSGGHDVRFGANGNDGCYPQGVDSNGNSVSQSGTGPAYSTSDPSKTYGPNDVTWPSSK
ncbi:hypothetical protein QBC34DRAFT_380769 [Podospora aff. communis PSN243]|uniref:Uncharacterized protein n=1 Tax=Podospora aff. communis PSN243 TaxID=3040156 RepID=A0AAV9GMG9_9PEZI|nr:hypothetical protein QBC34DRAFT_380769 [Podospora aff. communis PSN243]